MEHQRLHSAVASCIVLLTFLGANSLSIGQEHETIPPLPSQWFNDYARVTAGDTAQRLNQALQEFERRTSAQIVVAVFEKMESSAPARDYTLRIAQRWGVGQKGKNNGVVLFVFVRDR
jgi:uncharacterized protein